MKGEEVEEKKDTEKRGERERSTGYRRFNLRAMGPVTIWDSEDTGGGNRLPWDRSFSSSFLPALPSHPPHRVRVARIYTWRLLRRCTLVWMEAGHSTAPRTVKRKIYGFRRNSRRSIFEGERRERRAVETREKGGDRREERCARETRRRVKWILCISEAATRFWISIIAPCAIDEDSRDWWCSSSAGPTRSRSPVYKYHPI